MTHTVSKSSESTKLLGEDSEDFIVDLVNGENTRGRYSNDT